MDISTSLSFYKRKDVCEAIARYAEDKETSVRYANGGFSKRPGVISYPNDVLEIAKKKAQSFHCSEELWHNPLQIQTGMKRQELDELRKGWDLILDIDCPRWDFSKLTAHLFVEALKAHKVQSITTKFSGNKGFHIAVPFEAFPTTIHYNGEKRFVKDLFPEGPRQIAHYLLHHITTNFTTIKPTEKKIIFLDKYEFSFEELEELAQKTSNKLFKKVCPDCRAERKTEAKKHFIYQCTQCGKQSRPKGNPEMTRCESCGFPVEREEIKPRCPSCGSEKESVEELDITAVVEVDTILIASRHLYRMPYSLHEKSELVSIPISPEHIMDFEKEEAKPENIKFDIAFLNRERVPQGDAITLFTQAFDYNYKPAKTTKEFKPIEIPENAIAEEHFPPCIQNILKGLEDGKKRALFVLMNFLRSVGWGVEQIEALIYEWNERNPEPLREQYLKGQLSQIKKGKQILPPPSCTNHGYYKALQVCTPNTFCSKIRNPAQYAKKKHEQEANKTKKKTRKKTTKKTTKKTVTKAKKDEVTEKRENEKTPIKTKKQE